MRRAPRPPVVHSRARSVLFVVGSVVTLIVAALVAFVVALGAFLASLNDSFANFGGPKPIPIPPRSCPYLAAVQATAASAGEPWNGVDLFNDDPKFWAGFSSTLAPRLAAFELALRVAIPQVPRPVATELGDTLDHVVIGRAQLPSSRSLADFQNRTDDAVIGGYGALTQASGRVGDACGFTLAPPLPRIAFEHPSASRGGQ